MVTVTSLPGSVVIFWKAFHFYRVRKTVRFETSEYPHGPIIFPGCVSSSAKNQNVYWSNILKDKAAGWDKQVPVLSSLAERAWNTTQTHCIHILRWKTNGYAQYIRAVSKNETAYHDDLSSWKTNTGSDCPWVQPLNLCLKVRIFRWDIQMKSYKKLPSYHNWPDKRLDLLLEICYHG